MSCKLKNSLAICAFVMYNNKRNICRVVRAGRRSTIGNRVVLQRVLEGSNPLPCAKKLPKLRNYVSLGSFSLLVFQFLSAFALNGNVQICDVMSENFRNFFVNLS